MIGKTSPLLRVILSSRKIAGPHKAPAVQVPRSAMCWGTSPWLRAPNNRAPIRRRLMGSFKKFFFFLTPVLWNQQKKLPQQAFWNSVAFLCAEVPAWPCPPGSRASHTAPAKGNRLADGKLTQPPAAGLLEEDGGVALLLFNLLGLVCQRKA